VLYATLFNCVIFLSIFCTMLIFKFFFKCVKIYIKKLAKILKYFCSLTLKKKDKITQYTKYLGK
jgi:hypothetical protein